MAKIALVYDRVNKWGGAERVLLTLRELFPDAPLFTSVYSHEDAGWAHNFKVTPSFLQKFPGAKRVHELFAPFMPIAFESFNFDEYDAVISITSEAAKGIITSPKTIHICVCLTPTRYLWSGYDEYFSNDFVRFISKPIVWYLRTWDKIASQRPDKIVAISQTVVDRIKKYYKRDSKIIYPPVGFRNPNISNKPGEYFLVVSRLSKLTAYKRVDLAIKAANKLKVPLKIVGTGRDVDHYKQMAGPTVEFVGRVTDDELSEYYAGAKALLFPGNEDFGLVMVEAMAHGIPVIAYKNGGALEIVTQKTGMFFEKQTVGSVVQAIEKFDETRYNRTDCIENARKFADSRFKKEFLAFFNEQIKR